MQPNEVVKCSHFFLPSLLHLSQMDQPITHSFKPFITHRASFLVFLLTLLSRWNLSLFPTYLLVFYCSAWWKPPYLLVSLASHNPFFLSISPGNTFENENQIMLHIYLKTSYGFHCYQENFTSLPPLCLVSPLTPYATVFFLTLTSIHAFNIPSSFLN